MRKIIVYTLAVLSAIAVYGQNPSDSVKVYFHLNQGLFDPALRGNAASMDAFVEKINAAVSADNLDHIAIYGYTSPDGPTALNQRLAKTRSDAIAAHIIRRTGIRHDIVRTHSEGVAWNELRRLVANRKDVPSRAQILEILDDTIIPVNSRTGAADCVRRLKSLDDGEPYRWMLVHLFPELRHAFTVSIYLKSDNCDRPTAVAETIGAMTDVDASGARTTTGGTDFASESTAVAAATSDNSEQSAAEKEAVMESAKPNRSDAQPSGTELSGSESLNAQSAGAQSADGESAGKESVAPPMRIQDTADAGTPRHRLALKTNLPYYAILMPNLELEYLITDRWSVSLEGDVAWWGKYSHNKSYRIAIITPEVRYWIKPREPWHGIYVGVLAGGGWYDLQNGSPGYYGDGVMAGLSLGYMWPIGKRLSLEAGIGAGYMYSRFKEYVPYEGHHLYQRTKTLNYFGPLKVKLSLVWRLWDENKSKKRRHEE